MPNRRMRFIMQEARLADEVSWLEHELVMAEATGSDLSGQSDRLRTLAARLNEMAIKAERIAAKAKQKEAV